jgi:5-methylcytosine-specific restriction endonuclease McrA
MNFRYSLTSGKGCWGLAAGFRSSSTPTRSQIAQYWKGVAIRLHEVAKRRMIKADDQAVCYSDLVPRFLRHIAMDGGEAVCFGCERFFGDCCSYPEKSWYKCWDDSGLVRCHIIPRARGGMDIPSNLVLLCVWCHSEAPDVADRSYVIRWLNGRHDAVMKELERQGMESWNAYVVPGKELDITKMFHHIKVSGLEEDYHYFCSKFASHHWDLVQGPIQKVSTNVACWFAYARQRLKWDV